MHRLLFLLALTTASMAHAGDPVCDEAVSELALDQQVLDAEAAYRALDVETFEALQAAVKRSLPCVGQPLRPSVASRIHRLYGVALFMRGNEDQAVAAFASARAADSAAGLAGLVPDGHAMQLAFGRGTVDGPTERLAAAAEGQVFLDGVQSVERPTGRPVVMQWIVRGTPRFTRWLPAGLATPTYPVASIAPDAPPAADAEPRGKGRRKAGVVMLVAGAGAGAGAGLLYGAAGASRLNFEADHPEWNRTDLERVRERTNKLANASTITAAAAVGLTSVGLVLQW